MMRTMINIRSFVFWAVVIMSTMVQSSYGQDAESKYVRFKVNNIPDSEPPSIEIKTPTLDAGNSYKTEANEIILVGEVSDKSGIKFVTVNDDMRSINEEGIFTYSLDLEHGMNRVQLITEDKKGNLQEKQITIEYVPPFVTLADRIRKDSKYFGLIIGVDQYQDPNLPDLDNPIKDAAKLANTLTSQYTFEESNILFLKNPKRIDIVDALDYLASIVTPNDNLLIFYAGHGNWDERADLGYWLPSDAYLSSSGNWIRNSSIVDYLKLINSRHTLLISDACFSGSIFKSRSGFPQVEKSYDVQYNQLSRKAMTSGNLTEVPDRSAFTKYLINYLSKNDNTYLTSLELFGNMRNAVINNSNALPVYGVIQNVGDEGGEFVFLKKGKD